MRSRDAVEPLVIAADDPAVLAAAEAAAPGSSVVAMGGTMSRNLHLVEAGLVLRVHPRFVSRPRVVAERALRRSLDRDHRLVTATPVTFRGQETVRVRGRVAELERYVEHVVPAAAPSDYAEMGRSLGVLHRLWTEATITRPVVSTYGPPGTLRRWLSRLTAQELGAEAREQVETVARLVRLLDRVWVPASALPSQVVHGDARLANLPRAPDGRTVVLDLGFCAVRPRVHDLGYALAWLLLHPDDSGPVWTEDRPVSRSLVRAYESGHGRPLDPVEVEAVRGCLAATCLYLTAVAGWVPDPETVVLEPGNRRLVAIAADVLADPGLLD